jgi:FkbM family methyltransferase
MTHNELVQHWKFKNGDKTLRLNYDLNEDSLIIDGGGYKGEWSMDIFKKYNCFIHIFEPVKKYYELINEKFKNNKKINVHHLGLSNKNENIDIRINNDASSIYINNGIKETIKLVDSVEIFEKLNITNVDLIKLNVEGEEYNILERLIESKKIDMFNNLQIQFHRYGEKYDERKTLIENSLKKKFKVTYDYNYVWVNYKKI